mmetsp:Transcript_130844/g.317830  ORF Transcript_130844/g.317830 Transcript_130844/m.317830 type:complete len:996 (-) Transcript_130844:110-3097(-)
MKLMPQLCALCLLVVVPSTCARRAALRVTGVSKSIGSNNGAGSGTDAKGANVQSATRSTISSMVKDMIEGNGPKIHEIMKTANGKMDIQEAVTQLEGELPADVASLVKLTGGSSSKAKSRLEEDSMQKARGILNNMMSDAMLELDDVVFECKEFHERNRGTYEQVVNDLARLGSQLGGLAEKRVGAAQGIASYDAQRKLVEGSMETTTQQFTATKYEDSAELTRRKNDLAVFDFILNLTACQDGAELLQVGQGKPKVSNKVSLCSTKEGVQLRFNNPQLQAQVERMMTPDARMALRSALGQAGSQLNLLQSAGGLANSSTTPEPQATVDVMPVQEEPSAGGQWKKCVDGTPNCGLLHDLMSLEWGKFRDDFDELTATMTQNQQLFDLQTKNYNEQLTVIGEAKTKHMEVLAEAISNINADTEEMNEKDEQKRDLTQEYDKMCAEFRAKITEILFTKLCAVRKVRNGLLVNSTISPPSNISDCDVSDWTSKTGDCYATGGAIITCDDTCPRADPYSCGGKETMKRDVVVVPNANGVKCPPLERQKRCGQKKCPVSCSMSAWSGWSKCTKECESGVQAKTRSILVKPKNGGTGCDAVQEERDCNTGSCDRDCTLKDWSDWAPCSMACGGGKTTRTRKVLVPIRGQGKCPTQTSRQRIGEDTCNTQACNGDEVCIAQQDLIIALDASGSLKAEGFEILQKFTVNLTQRYEPRYYGLDAVRIGVVLFGNGHLLTLPDGSTSITPATNVQALTSDFDLVRQKISEQTWQRGFTNMAQALALADTMLSQGGRSEAQSAVLVISDGKYSFAYQTAEKARELKDKNVQVFMAPVTDFEGKELEQLQQWASQPADTNYERIPGLAALKYNAELFVQNFIAKFCPDSMSPSLQLQKEEARQYMLIHENGWPSDDCGKWYWEGSVNTKDDCAAKARARNLKAFAFGRSHAIGRCYSEAIDITQEFWDQFSLDRHDPPCPSGSWLFNPFYDTYALNPSSVSSVTQTR